MRCLVSDSRGTVLRLMLARFAVTPLSCSSHATQSDEEAYYL